MAKYLIGGTGLSVIMPGDGTLELHIDPDEGEETPDGELYVELDSDGWAALVRAVSRGLDGSGEDGLEIFATTGRMAACDGLSPMEAMAWACVEERGMDNAKASEVMTELCERPVTVNAVHKYVYGARRKMAIQ